MEVFLIILTLATVFYAGHRSGKRSSGRQNEFIRTIDNPDPVVQRKSKDSQREEVDWQLIHIEGAKLKWSPVLTGREAEVLRIIEDHLMQREKGRFRVLAQVSMGEFIKTVSHNLPEWKEKKIFQAFNSKRVDILVVDKHYFWPRVAIEYQGADHDQGNASRRDAVKRKALEAAHIRLIEIFAHESDHAITSKIDVWLDAWVATEKQKATR